MERESKVWGRESTTPKAWHREGMWLLKPQLPCTALLTGRQSQAAKGAAPRQPGRLRAGLGVPVFPNDGAYRLLAVHKDPGESGSLNTHLELGQMKINY